jgi:hypothetical protein
VQFSLDTDSTCIKREIYIRYPNQIHHHIIFLAVAARLCKEKRKKEKKKEVKDKRKSTKRKADKEPKSKKHYSAFRKSILRTFDGPAADSSSHSNGSRPFLTAIFPHSTASGENGATIRKANGVQIIVDSDVRNNQFNALHARACEVRVVARGERPRLIHAT